jgi:hypothetical protein
VCAIYSIIAAPVHKTPILIVTQMVKKNASIANIYSKYDIFILAPELRMLLILLYYKIELKATRQKKQQSQL